MTKCPLQRGHFLDKEGVPSRRQTSNQIMTSYTWVGNIYAAKELLQRYNGEICSCGNFQKLLHNVIPFQFTKSNVRPKKELEIN